MNLKDKKIAVVASLFISIYLGGCGLKADLYQTPAEASGEGIIAEDIDKDSKKPAPSTTPNQKNASDQVNH